MSKTKLLPDRRSFLGTVLPAGCLACVALSCRHAAQAVDPTPLSPISKHKFEEDSQWSFAEGFGRTYGILYESLDDVAEEIGREKLIGILKAKTERRAREGGQKFANSAGADFRTFTEGTRNPDRFWQHVLTLKVVEDTPQAFEIKVTECLWAKTVRGKKGEDIGYATICHWDFAFAEGYSPKLRMVRDKTLMQGDAFCNHRWIWRG
jgi:hypothetical protein